MKNLFLSLSLILFSGISSAATTDNYYYYCTCPDATTACKCYWENSIHTPHFAPGSALSNFYIPGDGSANVYMRCNNPGFTYKPESSYLGHSDSVSCWGSSDHSYRCEVKGDNHGAHAQMNYYICQPRISTN